MEEAHKRDEAQEKWEYENVSSALLNYDKKDFKKMTICNSHILKSSALN